jgi:hypothetical protein
MARLTVRVTEDDKMNMTPLEMRFNDGIELANKMRSGGRPKYWGGYMAGMMRAFFGARAVHESQHAAWLQIDSVGDEALGYRDGYHQLVEHTDGPGSAGAPMEARDEAAFDGQRTRQRSGRAGIEA